MRHKYSRSWFGLCRRMRHDSSLVTFKDFLREVKKLKVYQRAGAAGSALTIGVWRGPAAMLGQDRACSTNRALRVPGAFTPAQTNRQFCPSDQSATTIGHDDSALLDPRRMPRPVHGRRDRGKMETVDLASPRRIRNRSYVLECACPADVRRGEYHGLKHCEDNCLATARIGHDKSESAVTPVRKSPVTRHMCAGVPMLSQADATITN
jgi:hypothetical protein